MKQNAKHLLVLLLVALLAAMAVPVQGQDNPEVKLGVQPWLGYGPWWIAEEQGYFADHGLDVEIIDFTWDQDMNAALPAGSWMSKRGHEYDDRDDQPGRGRPGVLAARRVVRGGCDHRAQGHQASKTWPGAKWRTSRAAPAISC